MKAVGVVKKTTTTSDAHQVIFWHAIVNENRNQKLKKHTNHPHEKKLER